MKRLIIFTILHLCFLFSFHQVAQAQDVTKVYSIDELYDVIQQIVDNSDNGLSDVDPYGFHITVKVAVKQQGQLVNIVNPSVIQSIVESKIAEHNFDRFNLETDTEKVIKDGFVYIGVGLTPLNARNESFATNFQSYTFKDSKDGKTDVYVVHIGAQWIISTPKDGNISGNVYYVDDNGTNALLSDRPFLSSTNEKKVTYRRLGPGNEQLNSGEPEQVTWFPFLQTKSNFQITSLNPGHYFPQVKVNGCIQKFDDKDVNIDEEAVIKTEGIFRYDNPTKGQKIVRPNSVKASTIDKKEIFTTFSTKNKLEGYILTEGQNVGKWKDSNLVPEDSVQILKNNTKVWLEPYGWTSNSMRFPEPKIAEAGYYKFENLPSGVYLLYLENQKAKGKIVSICNTDENDRPKEANMTYQQNIGSSGYEITLDYSYSFGGNSLKIKAIWDNVVIGFGDQNYIPQKYKTATHPNKDSLGNYVDIKGNIIQPPYVFIDHPYYAVCGDNLRYCSDVLKMGNKKPRYFSFEHSGEFLGEVPLKADFEEENLYDQLEVIEYKKNATLLQGEQVSQGVYFTWQFVFTFKADEQVVSIVTVAASEIYDWIDKSRNNEGLHESVVFGGGIVDAKVDQDIIDKIIEGKDFTFTKKNEVATYTISAKMNK